VQKHLQVDLILSQTNHHYLLQIQFNIRFILTLKPTPPKCSPPGNFRTENVHQFIIYPMRATCIAHLILNFISLIILNKATYLQGDDGNNSKNVSRPLMTQDIQNR
jgi:hypothetical protein